MPRLFQLFSTVAITFLAAVTLAGCEVSVGSTNSKIDVNKVEKEITKGFEEQAAGAKVKSVRCPEKISGKKGTTVTCVITLDDDSTGDIKVKVTDNEGNVRWDVVSSGE